MGRMSAELASNREQLGSTLEEVAALRRENSLKNQQMADMHAMMCAVMQHNGIAPEAVNAFKPTAPEPPPDSPALGSPRRTGASAAPAPASTSEPSAASAATHGSLLPLGSATDDPRPSSIAGMSAEAVYIDFMYYGDVSASLRPNEKVRVRKIAKFFNAFATADEKAQLRDRKLEDGLRRRITKELHGCVRARLQQVFMEGGLDLAKDKPSCTAKSLSSSSVETLMADAVKLALGSMDHDA